VGLARNVSAALLLLAACGQGATARTRLKVPVGSSPQRGPSDAWVTVVEFADFECPFCRDEEPIVARLEAAHGDDLRLVFKHLPLSGIHPDAEAAAVAAECAGQQGRFWEMHDLLFVAALDGAALLSDARQVGLDEAAWQACRAAPEPASRVAADVSLAASLGVDSTPTFVVNGEVLVGAVPEGDLSAAIERARAAAVASGIPRAQYYDRAVLGE